MKEFHNSVNAGIDRGCNGADLMRTLLLLRCLRQKLAVLLSWIPEKKGVEPGCGPDFGQMDIRKPGDSHIRFVARPADKTWLCLCLNVPKVIQRGPRHGQVKHFIKLLVRDYWVITQFQATLKVSAAVITSQVGTGSKRNPPRMLVGGSLALNSLSFLVQGS